MICKRLSSCCAWLPCFPPSSGTATAQTAYPNKPITVIVPFAAGGPTDVVARILGEHMSRTLGQQLVVENVGGAGGSTGMTRVATAAPDGYTHRRRQHGHAVGRARALSQPQVQSGHQLRAGRHRQLHAAGDRGQEGHGGQGPQGVPRLPQGQQRQAELRPRRRRLDLATCRARCSMPSSASSRRWWPIAAPRPPSTTWSAARSTTWSTSRSTSSRRSRAAPSRPTPSPRPSASKACPTCRPPRSWASISSSAPGTPWSRRRARRRTIVDKLVDALNKALDDPDTIERYVELGSTAPQGADRGPAGLQKLVESEMARITPVLKAAMAAEPAGDAKK